MGKRNQERRRHKKKQRAAQQGARVQQGRGASYEPFAGSREADDLFTEFGDLGAGFGPHGPGCGCEEVPRQRKAPGLRQQIQQALFAMLEAPETEETAYVERAAGLLTTPRASRILLPLLDDLVGELWKRGWQPADVIRTARRELKPRHGRLVVALIASEARRYATAAMDPRWHDQLEEAGARVWWEEDATFLSDAARREKLETEAVTRCVLEAVVLLAWLPELPVLIPLPGAVAGAHGVAGPRSHSPKILGRIRALLTKAESTEYAEEGEALTSKAQQLMAQHSIDEALLAAQKGTEQAPGGVRMAVDAPYEEPKVQLLDAVAAANRCRTVWSRHLGFSTVIGFESDAEAVELLYTSLLVQATTTMRETGPRKRAAGAGRTQSFRRSFLTAYASRIRARLDETTRTVTQEAVRTTSRATSGPSDLLPVLAARSRAVDEAAEDLFPEMTFHTRAFAARDGEGWVQGTAAADRADLHRHTGALSNG